MKADTDSDVFLSEVDQLRDKICDLEEVVVTDHLTTKTLDALPAEKYSTIKVQVIRYPDLNLEKIERMMKTIFVNHSKRLPFTEKSQQSNRSDRGNDRGSAMSTVMICHYYPKPGHKVRD